jgi:hypothetical protein
VTDTEWMASNPAYAGEVIRLARQKAAEGGHDDLGLLADKLEWAMAAPDQLTARPLVQRMADAAKEHSVRTLATKAAVSANESENSAFGESQTGMNGTHRSNAPMAPTPNMPRYVKGLR